MLMNDDIQLWLITFELEISKQSYFRFFFFFCYINILKKKIMEMKIKIYQYSINRKNKTIPQQTRHNNLINRIFNANSSKFPEI